MAYLVRAALICASSAWVVSCAAAAPAPTSTAQAAPTQAAPATAPLAVPAKASGESAAPASASATTREVPSACDGEKPCFPPGAFVDAVCKHKFPDLPLYLFAGRMPWQHLYVKA